MLTNLVRFEMKSAERVYHFLCDNNSPISEVKEAIFQLTNMVAQVEANIEAAKKAQEDSKQAEVPQAEEKVNE
jgi:hypothetical protein